MAGRAFEVQFLKLLGRAAGVTRLAGDALVHGEISYANARRRADGTIVLVDWDEAGRAAPAIECGYPLINAFLSETDLAFDDRAASAFYEGYARSGGVLESRSLFDAALFHAVASHMRCKSGRAQAPRESVYAAAVTASVDSVSTSSTVVGLNS